MSPALSYRSASLSKASYVTAFSLQDRRGGPPSIGADPAVNHARTILDWARRTRAPRFTARDLMRGPLKGGRVRKVTDLEPALRVLETHGWARQIPGRTTRGRPTAPAYEVHPDLFEDAHEPD